MQQQATTLRSRSCLATYLKLWLTTTHHRLHVGSKTFNLKAYIRGSRIFLQPVIANCPSIKRLSSISLSLQDITKDFVPPNMFKRRHFTQLVISLPMAYLQCAVWLKILVTRCVRYGLQTLNSRPRHDVLLCTLAKVASTILYRSQGGTAQHSDHSDKFLWFIRTQPTNIDDEPINRDSTILKTRALKSFLLQPKYLEESVMTVVDALHLVQSCGLFIMRLLLSPLLDLLFELGRCQLVVA